MLFFPGSVCVFLTADSDRSCQQHCQTAAPSINCHITTIPHLNRLTASNTRSTIPYQPSLHRSAAFSSGSRRSTCRPAWPKESENCRPPITGSWRVTSGEGITTCGCIITVISNEWISSPIKNSQASHYVLCFWVKFEDFWRLGHHHEYTQHVRGIKLKGAVVEKSWFVMFESCAVMFQNIVMFMNSGSPKPSPNVFSVNRASMGQPLICGPRPL